MESSVQKTGFMKGVTILSGGSLLAQVITLFGTLIASRIFSPEVFGEAAVFSSIAYIIASISSLRYELAIVLPRKNRDGINIFALAIFCVLVISIVLVIVFYVLSDEFSRIFKLQNLRSIIWLIPVFAFLLASLNPMRFWFTRTEEYRINGIRRILTQAGVSIFVVAGGYLGFTNATWLVLLRMFGHIIGIIYYVINLFLGHFNLIKSSIKIKEMMYWAKRHDRFPKYSIPEVLLSTTAFYAPVLIMTSIFGTDTVGKYNHAIVLVGMPIELIAAAISQVYYQKLSAMIHEGKNVLEFSERIYSIIIKVVTYPAVILGVIAPVAISFVIGDVWYETGEFVVLMIPFMVMKFIAIPLMNLYLLKERQDVGLIFTIIQFIVQIASLTIGAIYGNAKIAVLYFSISGTLLYFVFTLWLLRMVGASFFRTISLYFKSLLIPLPFSIALILLSILSNITMFKMFVYILISTIVYYMITIRYDKYLNEKFVVFMSKLNK